MLWGGCAALTGIVTNANWLIAIRFLLGVVEALGEGVTDLTIGDHVVMVFMPSCGHCNPCAGGRPALCARRVENTQGSSTLSNADSQGSKLNCWKT